MDTQSLVPAQRKVVISMDQTTDLVELNLLLQYVSCNTSVGHQAYNFSEATALALIQEYMSKMFTIDQPNTIVLLCLYVPVFLLSLFGNMLVIFVVFRHQHMRRVKNLFLVNLAIADLAVTFVCIPMVAGQIVFRIWVYGEFMCKITGYMQGVAVTCSIFTLTALSIDRYLAIKVPLSFRHMSGKCQAFRTLAIVWILSAAFISPILYVRTVYTVNFGCLEMQVAYCIEMWPKNLDRKIYSIVLLVFTCVVPILVVTIAYAMIGKALCSDEFHRKTSDSSSTVMLGRKRVARMLIILIAFFIFCWLPYNICSLSLDLNFDYSDTRVLPFTLWLGHAHSALNPLLYWFLNKSFRHCMRKVIKCDTKATLRKDSPIPHGSGGELGDIFRFKPGNADSCSPPLMENGHDTTTNRRRRMVYMERLEPEMSQLTPPRHENPQRQNSASSHSSSSSKEMMAHAKFLMSPPTNSSHMSSSPIRPDEGAAAAGSVQKVDLEVHAAAHCVPEVHVIAPSPSGTFSPPSECFMSESSDATASGSTSMFADPFQNEFSASV